MKLWIGRFALMAAPFLCFGAVFECVLRNQVPISGVTPFQVSPDPELPHELRRSFRTLYKGHEIEINSLGFRGPEFPPRREGLLRVALVGDSITFGDAIGWEDTLGVRLGASLEARGLEAEVLNCGIPGLDATDVALITVERVLPLEPDLVVYVFVCNDVVSSTRANEIPPDAEIDHFASYPLRSALLQFLGVRAKGMLRSLRDSDDEGGWVGHIKAALNNGGSDRIDAAIHTMQSSCSGAGVPFLVGSFPFLVSRDSNPFEAIEACIREVCSRQGVPLTEFVEAFPDGNLGSYWSCPFDSHPNGEANQHVADLLADTLALRLKEL